MPLHFFEGRERRLLWGGGRIKGQEERQEREETVIRLGKNINRLINLNMQLI